MFRTVLLHAAGWACLVALAMSPAGCARKQPYRLGAESQYRTSAELRAVTSPQIERGRERPVLDAVGWVIGIPGKITLWDRRVDNHRISPATETTIAEYLAANELSTVKVRLNQYAPRDEWRRLRNNKSVSWGWRYSLGTLSWLGDTIFPGRVWGGDNYNPFTNTVNIYSDVPSLALHEGGHAKDFARRDYPGTYAAVYAMVPVAPLWYEAIATRDALGYLHDFGTADDEREAYTMLYPAYGTYVGGTVGDFIPGYGTAVYAAGVVGGHIAGRLRAARVEPRSSAVDTPIALDDKNQTDPWSAPSRPSSRRLAGEPPRFESQPSFEPQEIDPFGSGAIPQSYPADEKQPQRSAILPAAATSSLD